MTLRPPATNAIATRKTATDVAASRRNAARTSVRASETATASGGVAVSRVTVMNAGVDGCTALAGSRNRTTPLGCSTVMMPWGPTSADLNTGDATTGVNVATTIPANDPSAAAM